MQELFESLDLLEERVNALSNRVRSLESERDRLRQEVGCPHWKNCMIT